MREDEHERRGAEYSPREREDEGSPVLERCIVPAIECLVDLLLPHVALNDEADPDHGEGDPDHLVRPRRRPLRELRQQPAGGEADRERGQPGTPPREVGALAREPRTARRVPRLVERLLRHRPDGTSRGGYYSRSSRVKPKRTPSTHSPSRR